MPMFIKFAFERINRWRSHDFFCKH